MSRSRDEGSRGDTPLGHTARDEGSRDGSLDTLFDAARRERPSPEARRRALERIRRINAPRRRAWGVRWLGLAAAAALAALVVVVAILPKPAELPISAERARPAAPRAEPAAPAREAAEPPREPVAAPAAATPSLSPIPRERASADSSPNAATPRRPAPAPPAPRSSRGSRSASEAAAAPTLEAELGLLDRARSELAAGKPRAAQASLDAYDALGGRALALEARLLRIQTLAANGERARAAASARQFIKEHADSPLAERARAFVDQSP